MTRPRPGSMELVVGPAGSGKTAAALTEYGNCLCNSAIHGGAHCLWIAPSGSAAADVRDSLAVGAAGALLEPGVTTFARLAARCVAQAGLRIRRLTRLQRRRVVGRIIAEAAGDGRIPYFAAVARSPGLAAIVDDAIADFQRRGLTPLEVHRHADEDARRRDLAELFARYSERLAANRLVDDAGLLTAAAGALASDAKLAPRLELVVVDGFSQFSAGELAVLAALRDRARGVVVTLPGDPAERSGGVDIQAMRADLFALPLATAEQLARSGGHVRRPAAEPIPWPALAHLERNLFRSIRQLQPAAPAVEATLDRLHIVAASGVQAEIDEIAGQVKQRLLAGAAPSEVVVAFRSTRDVADRVRQAFDDFGIPTVLDAPRRLAAAPLVRSLTNVLRLAAEDWPYRHVLRAAGDRSLRLFDEPPGARAAIELCVRHSQLPRGRAALMRQIEHWAGVADAEAEPTGETAAVALEALQKLASLLGKLPKQAELDRWLAALGALAEHVGLLRPATDDDAASWSILADALRGAGQVDQWTGYRDQTLTLAEVVELIVSTAAQAPGAGGHDAAGRVRVLSAEQARFTRPRHLLVGGLSEQAFPAVRLASVAEDAAAVAEARSAEMLLFYQLVTRPTDSLTLSYPALDERGQPMPASPFLLEVERAFSGAEVSHTIQPLDAGRCEENERPPMSRSSLRRSAVGRALEGKQEMLAAVASNLVCQVHGSAWAWESESRAPADAAVGRPIEVGKSILDGIEAIADRGRRERFGAYEGLLRSDEVSARLRERFGADHLWSPSQLETYAACPFVFFGRHVLKLQQLPDLALQNDMARRGGVLHETLAQLYSQLRDVELEPAAAVQTLRAMFGETLAAVAQSRPGWGLEAALREIERRQIASWAEEFARQDAEYRAQWMTMSQPPQPAHFEVRFGPPRQARDGEPADALSTNDPFALQVNVGGADEQVQIAGQVDRIDVGRVGERLVFNVIDYKSGKSHPVKPVEIAAGRQLQLPLYALAVEELLLKDQGAAPLSAGYWSVGGKGFVRGEGSPTALDINHYRQGALEPAPGWEKLRKEAIARVGAIIAAIRRGQFPVFNDDKECTRACELRTICRIAHVRSLEKTWPTRDESPTRLAQRRKDADQE